MRIEKLFQCLKTKACDSRFDDVRRYKQSIVMQYTRYIQPLDRLKRAHQKIKIIEWAAKMALGKYHAGDAVTFKPRLVIRKHRLAPQKLDVYPEMEAKAWLKEHDPQTLSLRICQLGYRLEVAAMTTTDTDWRMVLATLRVRLALAYDAMHYAKVEAEVVLNRYA